MHKAFYRLFKVLDSNRALFFISVGIIFLTLLFFALKIELNDDISKFIPKNDTNKQLQKVLKNTKFDETIVVNFHKSEEASIEDLTKIASNLVDSVNKGILPYIKDIDGYVDSNTAMAMLNFAYDNAALFLTKKDYETLENKILPDSLYAITESNYKTLVSPTGIISRDLILKDPLKISFLALQNLNPIGTNADFKLKNNFLVTEDERNLLLFITPKSDTDNEDFAKSLYNVRDNLLRNESNIDIEIFGGKLIAAANAKQIKRDILFTVSITLLALFFLFILYYRAALVPLILIVPTVFGGLMGLVVLLLIRDNVSAISLGIGSVLLGVTLDYSLHILTHIRNGSSIKTLYANISPPILLSSITTAIAFLCLLFIDSQALKDLGVFASVSVVSASVFALLFIPHVYKVQEVGGKNSSNLILDKIAGFNYHKSKILIVAMLGIILLSTYTYNDVKFNHNLSDLNFIPPELHKAEKNLDKLTNTSSKSLYITAFGQNLETVMQTNDEVMMQLETLQSKNLIKYYNSLSSFINSDSVQLQKINKWKNFWKQNNVDSVQANLIIAGNEFGFKSNAFDSFYNYLKKEFNTITLEDVKGTEIFNPEKFITENDELTTITTMVKVDEDYVDALKSNFSNIKNTLIIDRQNLNESLLGNLKSDFNELVIYCLIAVIVLLLIYYRNFMLTLVTVIPILLTWLVTIGLMGYFDLRFNILNIVISSFIFGLGVDYSIFITNGLHKSKVSQQDYYSTNKTSILLSAITTVMGIGVLVFAKHPALQSIALISIIGILAAMLISFTIQPLLFNFIYNNRRWAK